LQKIYVEKYWEIAKVVEIIGGLNTEQLAKFEHDVQVLTEETCAKFCSEYCLYCFPEEHSRNADHDKPELTFEMLTEWRNKFSSSDFVQRFAKEI